MDVRLLSAAAAALLTVACGDAAKKALENGPSAAYGGPTTPATFSASTDGGAVVSEAFGALEVLGEVATDSVAVGVQAPQRAIGVKETLALAADLFHQPEVATASGVLVSNTRPCTGSGAVTMAVNHQNANDAITTNGDYVEVAFAACRDTGSTFVKNGGFRLTIDDTLGADFVALATSITTNLSFGLTVAYDNFSVTNAADGSWFAVDGDIGVSFVANFSAGTISYGISGQTLDQAVHFGPFLFGRRITALPGGDGKYHQAAVETYTGMGTSAAALTQATAELDARLCTTVMGGCVNIDTNPVFTKLGLNNYPSSGAMTVSAGSNSVTLTALNATTARVSWNIGGSSGSVDKPWTEL